jgi:hypothetical protein
MIRVVFFIWVILLTINSTAQTWPRIFGVSEMAWGYDIIETYDKGYIVLSQVDPGWGGTTKMQAWLIKTDINGNTLWEKRVFHPSYHNAFNDVTKTTDGGYIMIGSTTWLDPGAFDIMFMKLNACGEKEWCTILTTPDISDYGLKVQPVSDGYIGLLSYYTDGIEKRVWTIKLDNYGNIVWRKVYFQDDPGYRNEDACDLLVTPDGGLLVTAYGYYDPQGGWNGWLRSILVKTDSLGNEEWITRWGEDDNFFSLLPMNPSLALNGVYYCANTHYSKFLVEGYVPAFIRTQPDGIEDGYVDLLTGTESAIATTLHFLYPDTLIMACGWNFPLHDYSQGVAKSDTAGNHIQVKILIDSVINTFQGSTLTFDNKIVLVGGFTKLNTTSDVYLFKINSNLELDSAYTAPRTYDSLCPYPIVSDTMDLEGCGIYTSMHDPILKPDVFKLKAFPVPAKDRFTIQIPGQLLAESSMGGVTINTVYHQWDKTTLQIIDINGRIVFEKEVYFNEKEVEINCSAWSAGFYAARLVYKNMKVGGVKVLVGR